MPKITQEISKNGKAAFTKKVNSSTDKGRGVMPPPSKAHKKGKGKGSYNRKNAFDEDEQRGGVNIFDYVEQKQEDGYGVALIDNNDQIITPYVDPSDYPDIELSGNGSAPRVINDPSKDGWFVMIHSGILETEPEKMGYKKYNSFDEESYSGQYKKGETSEAKKKALDNIRKNKKNKTDIKDFKDFTKSKKEGEEDEQSCWKGYKKQGTKKKGGKNVNNCVEESTNLHKFIEAIMTSNHAQAHKQLKNAINSKIQKRIAQEIDKPLF